MAHPPPRSSRMKKKKNHKPRFLPECQVLFEMEGNLVEGKILEVLNPVEANNKTTISYKIQQTNNQLLRLNQSKIFFAPDTPCWIETKRGSEPGHVDCYDKEEGKYKVKMLADGKIVKNIPPHLLRYNALQAAIKKAYETQALIKQEAMEDEEQRHEHSNQKRNSSTAAAASLPIVKQEVQEEDGEAKANSTATTVNNAISSGEAEIDLVSDEGSDDDEDENATTDKTNLMSIEEHLARRKRDLPHNKILNESPNKFWSIVYSPKHDIRRAIETIQSYIRQYGAAPGRSQHGGIGPVLHKRCLYFHIQGQCKKHGCKFQEDHVELTPTEAMTIEAALEPALTWDGPIFTPDVILAVEEDEKDDNDANNKQCQQPGTIEQPLDEVPTSARDPRQRLWQKEALESTNKNAANNNNTIPSRRQDPRERRGERRQRDATNNGQNNNNSNKSSSSSSTLKKKRQRRFNCADNIKMPLPAAFLESFYRRALCNPDGATEIQKRHGCEWELECSNNGKSIQVTIRGDDYDQIEKCHKEIPKLLCRSLPNPYLRGRLLWDLNRLAANDCDEQFLSIDKGLLEKDEETSCWLTVIPLTATYTPNQSLCDETATNFAQTLKSWYSHPERYCRIGVHAADAGAGTGGSSSISTADYNFGSVPSHIVIWSAEKSRVRNCRTDFFKLAKDADDADDAW